MNVAKGKCVKCGRVRKLEALGFCSTCYHNARRTEGVCKNCKKSKPIYAKGECKPCRDQVYRKERQA